MIVVLVLPATQAERHCLRSSDRILTLPLARAANGEERAFVE
jgi:hypothetical protein